MHYVNLSDQPPGLKEPLGKTFRRTDGRAGRGRDVIMFTAGPGLRGEGTGTTHLAETAAIVQTAVQEWVQWGAGCQLGKKPHSEAVFFSHCVLYACRLTALSSRELQSCLPAVRAYGASCWSGFYNRFYDFD